VIGHLTPGHPYPLNLLSRTVASLLKLGLDQLGQMSVLVVFGGRCPGGGKCPTFEEAGRCPETAPSSALAGGAVGWGGAEWSAVQGQAGSFPQLARSS